MQRRHTSSSARRTSFPMRFALLFLLLYALFSIPARAALLENVPQRLVQPNGTVVNCLASGDEYYHWLHDTNGFVIVKDPQTGYFVYAKSLNGAVAPTPYVVGTVNPSQVGLKPNIRISTARYNQRLQAYWGGKTRGALIKKAPATGTINNIVVFIRFSDEAEYTDQISTYNSMFNNSTANANSMKNYYSAVSYNQLTVNTTFFPTTSGTVVSYKDTHPRSYFEPYDASTNPGGYSISDDGSDAALREHALLKAAVNGVSAQIPANLVVDGDGDGYVDNVCFVVSGDPGGWSDLLWPHQWVLFTANNAAYINGKQVWTYNFQLRNSMLSSGVGVLCHEMFHSLGAPDLYHYSYDGLHPVWNWDIMERDQDPPQQMGAYMKYRYGKWISSIPEITSSGTYTLSPLTSSSNNCYKIASPNSTSEYYVLEYRKKTGIDSTLPGSGLLIYRINSAEDGNGNRNGPPDEVYIYRPGGTPSVNGNTDSAAFSADTGRTSLNDNTDPSGFLTGGSPGGLSISQVGTAGSTISFRVSLGDPTDPYQPDMLIKNAGESSYSGNNIYNMDGANQSKAKTVDVNTAAIYYLQVQNDGMNSDTLKVTGTAAGAGWTVRYFDAASGGTDITAQVTGANGWRPQLASTVSQEFRVEVTAGVGVAAGAAQALWIQAQSLGDATKSDIVVAATTRVLQAPYFTDFESSVYGWTQSATSGLNTNAIWTIATPTYTHSPTHCAYAADDSNAGSTCLISPSIKMPASGSCTLSFWHTYAFEGDAGGNYDGGVLEISTDGGNTFADLGNKITQGGYTGIIENGFNNPLADQSAWVIGSVGTMTEVRADLSSYAGQIIMLRWRLGSDESFGAEGWYVDDVSIDVPMTPRQPDLQIRNAGDTNFIGDNIYNVDVSQTKSQTVAQGTKATYQVRIQNDSTVADSLVLTGPGDENGWTVRYYNALTGGTDITTQVTGAGYTLPAPIAAGASVDYRIEVTPTNDMGATVMDVLLTVMSTADNTKTDAVKASTSRALNYIPVAVTDTAQVNKNTPKVIAVLANDTDPENDPLTIINKTNGQHGTVTINSGTTVTYTPNNNYLGTDSFTYTISDGHNNSAVGTVNITVVDNSTPISAVSLSAAPTSPRMVNTAITLTATPVNGISPEYKYRVGYQDATGWHWTDLNTTYTAAKTKSWTPIIARNYSLVVWAREAGHTANYDCYSSIPFTVTPGAGGPLTAVTLGTSPTSPQMINSNITLTATKTGGTNVEYKYRAGYQDATGWHWADLNSTYTTSNTFTWKPTVAHTYSLVVWAREMGHTANYDVYGIAPYAIKAIVTSVNLITSPPSPVLLNTNVNLTATAVGGANVEYQFRAGYQNTSTTWVWSDIRTYSTSPTCTWKPTVLKTYTLVVYAREVGSGVAYQAYSSISCRVGSGPVTAVSLQASPTTPRAANTSITLTANATGGTSLEYKFRAGYQDATGWHWSDINAYNTSTTCTWTPTVAHTYTLTVYVREVGNTSAYQAYGTQTYVITAH